MKNNFEIIAAFFTPFIKIKFPEHQKYNFTYFIEKKNYKPLDWKESVNTSFPNISDDDEFVSIEQRESLKSDLISCISKTFDEMRMPSNIEINSLWYNIYHDDQGQEPHNHLPLVGGVIPYWSGIYYYQNSTPTTFIRSDQTYNASNFPNSKQSVLAPCFYETFCPDINDGDILLFPSYLNHYIFSDENHRENMRVTFSFNIDLDIKGLGLNYNNARL